MNLKNLSPYCLGGIQLILLPYLILFKWYSNFFFVLYSKRVRGKIKNDLPKDRECIYYTEEIDAPFIFTHYTSLLSFKEWNCRPLYLTHIVKTIKVRHCRLRLWKMMRIIRERLTNQIMNINASINQLICISRILQVMNSK
jgi:hypothetical protein